MALRSKLRLLVAILPLHLRVVRQYQNSVGKKMLHSTAIATGKSLCRPERLMTATKFSSSVVASEDRADPNTDLETLKADVRVDEL